MSSKIERLIDELEDYIEGCKYQPLSSTKIIVLKEDIDELIQELRSATPEEIKHYQKIVNQRQAILDEAKAEAKKLMEETQTRTKDLLSENEIMKHAYAAADNIVGSAKQKAESILGRAVTEANLMRTSAEEYTDGLLADIDKFLTQSAKAQMKNNEALLEDMRQCTDSLNHYIELVQGNRRDLRPTYDLALEQEIVDKLN